MKNGEGKAMDTIISTTFLCRSYIVKSNMKIIDNILKEVYDDNNNNNNDNNNNNNNNANVYGERPQSPENAFHQNISYLFT